MKPRFVLDEGSWATATEMDVEALSNAIDQLLNRLDVARERNEGVVKHQYFYETSLGDDVVLWAALFDEGCSLQFDHDLKELLSRTLDQVGEFDDSMLTEYDVEICGRVQLAPGVAWAHSCCSARHQVAVLPLPLDDIPGGRVPVVVNGVTNEICFVTEELEHVDFFRSIIEIENANESMFECLAASAFPVLEWADGVWKGLRDFSRPYISVRRELVRYLGGLNDHGASCFHEYGAGDPQHLSEFLSARIGAETSDENGKSKQNSKARRDRTRRHRGEHKVFWWHVKLQLNIDRIYFLYEPPSTEWPLREDGRIVVGVFKDHCV